MNLFRRYSVGIPRGEPLAETCRRIARAARAASERSVQARFYLGDRIDIKTSGVQRAVAQFEWLAPLVITDERVKALSNLDARFAESNPAHAPVDVDQLAELLDAVPKPCPFGKCIVLFDDLRFAKPDTFEVIAPYRQGDRSVYLADSTGAFHANAAPGLILSAQMSSTRVTQQTLTATIAITPPAAGATSLPALDPAIAAVLDQIGKRSRDELLYQCDAADRPRLREMNGRVGEIAQRWHAERDAVMRRLPLPHPDLPIDPGPSIGHGYTSPHKAPLIAAFEPRGFRYRSRASGHGVFTFAKRTARNNRLSLHFDVRSWSHRGSCQLRVENDTSSHYLEVTFVPGSPADGYPIRSEENWQKMVANAAVVIDYLEREYVTEIEAVLPPAPAWWQFPD